MAQEQGAAREIHTAVLVLQDSIQTLFQAHFAIPELQQQVCALVALRYQPQIHLATPVLQQLTEASASPAPMLVCVSLAVLTLVCAGTAAVNEPTPAAVKSALFRKHKLWSAAHKGNRDIILIIDEISATYEI